MEVYLIGVYPIEVYHIGKGAIEISGLPHLFECFWRKSGVKLRVFDESAELN